MRTANLNGLPIFFGSGSGTDIVLCRPPALSAIDLSTIAAQGAARVWAALSARGVEPMPLDDELCIPIDDARSAAAAEVALCERLRADTAASDGPLAHWIERRISLRISRWLARHTHLRPNQITVVGTTVGLLAAGLLSIGTYWTGVAGTLLFLCATIIDGCDGEVARLTFSESPSSAPCTHPRTAFPEAARSPGVRDPHLAVVARPGADWRAMPAVLAPVKPGDVKGLINPGGMAVF